MDTGIAKEVTVGALPQRAGAYWYMAHGQSAVICEKREGESFVRFTNGGRQSWARPEDRFIGPLTPPN